MNVSDIVDQLTEAKEEIDGLKKCEEINRGLYIALRERLAAYEDTGLTPEEVVQEKNRLQQAEADNAELIAVINDVYPMVAGRTLDLMSAGEEKAAKHWNKASQKLYRATQYQNPGTALLKELEGLRGAATALKTIFAEFGRNWPANYVALVQQALPELKKEGRA